MKTPTHTTHFACKEMLDKYGDKTKGCCCTGHSCKKTPTQQLPEDVEKLVVTIIDVNKNLDGSYNWFGLKADVEHLLQTQLLLQKDNIVMQCYLECLAVECGEGECSRAIATKFNLEVHNEQ